MSLYFGEDLCVILNHICQPFLVSSALNFSFVTSV
uniref:Uncharacterized protein n=1 Tax=Rhizophora mucronata TaxID=61149 RepID=A0A2P2MX82_RHIMU